MLGTPVNSSIEAKHPSRIAALDALRGLAVLMVFAHHLTVYCPWLRNAMCRPDRHLGWFWSILTEGSIGVDLFFVISGFLIGGILMDHRDSPSVFRTFYTRRFLRIVPLAWLWIAISLILGKALAGSIPAYPIWSYPSFTMNVFLALAGDWPSDPTNGMWSLCIEEQFYLLLPLLLCRTSPARTKWIGPAMIVIAESVRLCASLSPDIPSLTIQVLTPMRLDVLGIGVTLAWWVRSPFWDFTRGKGSLFASVMALSMLGFVVALATPGPIAYERWGYLCIAVFFGALVALCIESPHRTLGKLTSLPLLQLVGKYSYCTYLFQFLGFSLSMRLASRFFPLSSFQGFLIESLLCVTSVTAVSALSWRYLESRLVRFGRSFTY